MFIPAPHACLGDMCKFETRVHGLIVPVIYVITSRANIAYDIAIEANEVSCEGIYVQLLIPLFLCIIYLFDDV